MKTKIELLVEDDFLDEFMASLPKEKVWCVEASFETNQKQLSEVVQSYRDSSYEFIPYFKSMKNISLMFQQKRGA